MGKLDTRIIPVEDLFAPVIADGQVITCYIDEEMTPYAIQGDNIIVDKIVDKSNDTLSSLTTDAKNNLVAAINEIDSHADTNARNIGVLSSLSTDAKSNLVEAISEVDSHANTNAEAIGSLPSLNTSVKTSVVAAVNEVKNAVGTLANLDTDAKSSLVEAINEIKYKSGSGDTSGIGTLASLETNDKSSIVDAINEIYAFVKILKECSKAELHNSFYRGKYLGNTFTDAQSEAIRAGTFDDLWLGDYWTIKSKKWRIVDFDYFFGIGSENSNNGVQIHHVVIVPDSLDTSYTGKMNDTATTEGGYVGSKMYTTNLESTRTYITNLFTSEHILTHTEMLTSAMEDGKPSNGSWYEVTIELMTEIMFFGTKITSAPDIKTSAKNQFSAFKLNRSLKQKNTWLRDIVDEENFSCAQSNGCVLTSKANVTRSIIPYFLLY